MLDWLGVTFVSKATSECDCIEALYCEQQALEKKDRSRASCKIISSLWPNSAKNSTPVWLIGLKVSNATGWIVMVSGKVIYLAVFLSAAISAILPGESAVEPTYESANVCTTVTSRASGLPLCHGISVTPSGRFPSVHASPDGTFVDGIPAFERVRHIRSFRALAYDLWLAYKRLCKPLISTAAHHMGNCGDDIGQYQDGVHRLSYGFVV